MVDRATFKQALDRDIQAQRIKAQTIAGIQQTRTDGWRAWIPNDNEECWAVTRFTHATPNAPAGRDALVVFTGINAEERARRMVGILAGAAWLIGDPPGSELTVDWDYGSTISIAPAHLTWALIQNETDYETWQELKAHIASILTVGH